MFVLQADNMVAIIQLGINSSSAATAAAAARILPQLPDLPADAVAELLLTAIARQPVNSALKPLVAAHFGGWQVRQLTGEQLLVVLKQVAAACTQVSDGTRDALNRLCYMIRTLPAAYAMSKHTLAGLLHTTIAPG
jgi:hypothetical protein